MISPDRTDDLLTSANEAAMNAVVHANGGTATGGAAPSPTGKGGTTVVVEQDRVPADASWMSCF